MTQSTLFQTALQTDAPTTRPAPDPMPKIPASRILIAALIAGIDGDLLLRSGSQWRAGFAIWIAGIVASALFLDPRATRERRLMLAGLAAAPFGLVMRDADLLYGVDFGAMLAMGMLVIWHGSGRTLADLSVVEAIRAGFLSFLNTIAGGAGVLSRTTSERTGGGTSKGHARALLIGAVLAAPPLLVVSALLMSSDQVFASVLDNAMQFVAVDSFGHVALAAFLAWIAAGWLRAATGDTLAGDIPAPASPGLRFASIAVPLYSLVALLALFLATQARVLFGGAEFLRQTAGLTVANYARQGFFQLILASAIVTGTLVIAEWLLSREDHDAARHFRLAGRVLLALVTTLLVSAATRIGIYVGMFGHSVDRTFALAAIVFVLAVLVTCALTTLRGRAQRFAPSVVGVAIGWVVVLNLINPEGLVVRANIARAQAGAAFDIEYHAKLSADALPVTLALASRLPAAQCQALGNALSQEWTSRGMTVDRTLRDWRGTSLPLEHASRWYMAGTPVACGASR